MCALSQHLSYELVYAPEDLCQNVSLRLRVKIELQINCIPSILMHRA